MTGALRSTSKAPVMERLLARAGIRVHEAWSWALALAVTVIRLAAAWLPVPGILLVQRILEFVMDRSLGPAQDLAIHYETLTVDVGALAEIPRVLLHGAIATDGGPPTVQLGAEWLVPQAAASSVPHKIVLYLHGGGFFMGSGKLMRTITTQMARRLGVPVVALDYRKAPMHPFPAQLHDVFAAYLALVNPDHPAVCSSLTRPCATQRRAYLPENITLMGDSAGAGLVLAFVEYLRSWVCDPNILPPGKLILISPWLTMHLESLPWSCGASYDWLPLHAPMGIGAAHPALWARLSPHPVRGYVFGNPIPVPFRSWTSPWHWLPQATKELIPVAALQPWLQHPLISPGLGPITPTLPRILMVSGGLERTLADHLAYSRRFEGTVNRLRHEIYTVCTHDFPAFWCLSPESARVYESFRDFVVLDRAFPDMPASLPGIYTTPQFYTPKPDLHVPRRDSATHI